MCQSKFTAPPVGFYKCFVCGTQIVNEPDVPYEEQACCPDDDCDGQVFCLKWPNWKVVPKNANCVVPNE